MKASIVALGLPALGMAFPQMMGVDSREEMLDMLKQKREAELAEQDAKRGLIGDLLDSVSQITQDVTSLLGTVASAVDPDNFRPEPGYVFQAPGPNDSRGPCPGLNLLANYGYLPRDGRVTYSQILDATSRGFNMGADLATVLAVFAILTDGDIDTESWYLGAGPGNVGGLNRHSTVEADISPNREDYWLGCGDNHQLSSRLFRQNVAIAKQVGDFGEETMGRHYAQHAAESKLNNPYLYYFPFPSIVSLAAFSFYPNFFSNGTYGAGGVANYESISSIIGAQYDEKTGQFKYVPERWPEQGWYRRAVPYTAVQALTDAFTLIYPKNPVAMPIAQLGTPNFNVQTVLCDAYMGIGSIVPLQLGLAYEDVATTISWAVGKLAAVGLDGTALGCPLSSISPNTEFYPNSTMTGGPLNPPPAVARNTGNNVYNKTYFCKAPGNQPKCSHTCG